MYKKYIFFKKKRYWVHLFTGNRLTREIFYTSFVNLRENNETFFNYFRMSVKSFDELAVNILPKMKSQDTYIRLSIPPVEMLAVTLR